MPTTDKKPALHQMLALRGPKKLEMDAAIARIFGLLSEGKHFKGQGQSYTAYNEGDKHIPTTKNEPIQYRAKDLAQQLVNQIAPAIDIMHTVESGNSQCSAALMINGESMFKNADGTPIKISVTTLLHLERMVKNMLERAKSIATLDIAHQWSEDQNAGCKVTPPIRTVTTRKQKVTLVKAPATEQHPAQVDVYDNDVPVGEYMTTHMSSALTPAEKNALIARLQMLFDAIVLARNEANMQQIEQLKIGETLLAWAFEPIMPAATT